MAERRWYVVGYEAQLSERDRSELGEEGVPDQPAVDVWGPFDSETDARAFALDTHGDNGWERVQPEFLSPAAAGNKSSRSLVIWPYQKGQLSEEERDQ